MRCASIWFDRVERDADDDHDATCRPTGTGRGSLRDDRRDDADDGDVERAAERDARQHLVDVVGGLLALADAGDERLLLLQVVGHVDRLEGDRRVEVAEEDDQKDVEVLNTQSPRSSIAWSGPCPGS